MATYHYAKDTIEWYRSNNILFLAKDQDPPNCPKLRPIEKFWDCEKILSPQKMPMICSENGKRHVIR